MSKYIIELDDRIKLVTSVGVTENGVVYTTSDYVHNLEELNSDYINEHYGSLQDEAYQRGHDDGYEAGCATAFKPVSDAEYQRGLDEAMSAFKKLYSCGWERDWKAMGFEFDEGEWSTSFEFIIGHYTAAEIVEKVKAYEDKQKDHIKVGDEVEWDGDKYVVTYLNYDIETSKITDYDLLAYDGSVVDHVKKCTFIKTGKHYDIASILEAMRK